ncbi:MAG: hydroxymethylbilane synthase [Eubacteriaceae bacterium]|nr:hydroxymethylbilane synthase [Eubacteriaceae bacterium]
MKIKVGTRGSKLAIAQCTDIMEKIKSKVDGFDYELIIIKTRGDIIQDVSLDKIGEKGIFVKEIEEALIEKKIDVAVHSMKDMPGTLPDELMFSYTPKREDFRDILIMNHDCQSLEGLPVGAKIATGSKRREYQILKKRPDLEILPIRGNVDTRLRKMKEQNLDGIIMAAAGIKRLGLIDKLEGSFEYLEPEVMLPSPAQGTLGLEIRKDNVVLHEIIKSILDAETQIQADAERAFLDGINGSCHVPIGALCTVSNDEILLEGLLGNEDGSILVRKELRGEISQSKELGYRLAELVKGEIAEYER